MSVRDSFAEWHVCHLATRRTAVILLHGLCSTPDELRPVESSLRSRGYSVQPLVIDGYSFDAQARTQRATSWVEWIDIIERHVDALRTTHDSVLLIGISAGASLALGAAIRCGDRIDGMVLMSTTLRFDGWAIPRRHFLLPLALYTPLGRFWRYRERAPYGVKNERVRAWIERELRTRRISSAGSSVIGIDHLREHARLIRHVRGELDRVTCRQVLRCSTLRFVVLGNSFHMITIDNDRQQVVQETVAFAASFAHGTA